MRRGRTELLGTASGTGHPGLVPPLSVVGRVMAVFGAFVSDGPHLRTGDVARITGLPSATTSRLLKELVDLGALTRVARGRYAIGPRLWQVGALGAEVYQAWRAAEPWLSSLAHATGCRAHLTVLSGSEGLRLAEAEGGAGLLVPCWVVERLPLHATAAGLVLLAFNHNGLTRRIADHPLERYTPQTPVVGHRLLATVDDVRRHGFALSRGQHRLGHAELAAPLLDSAGHALGALEITLRRTVDLRTAQAMVSGHAHQATEQLALTCRHGGHETVTRLTGWRGASSSLARDEPQRERDQTQDRSAAITVPPEGVR